MIDSALIAITALVVIPTALVGALVWGTIPRREHWHWVGVIGRQADHLLPEHGEAAHDCYGDGECAACTPERVVTDGRTTWIHRPKAGAR